MKEIQDALSVANRQGGRVSGVDLGALNRVLEYSPEDMTVTAEAGMNLVDLQRQHGYLDRDLADAEAAWLVLQEEWDAAQVEAGV